MQSVMKRVKHGDPGIQLHALTVSTSLSYSQCFPPKGERGVQHPHLSWSTPFFPGVLIKRQYTLNEMYNAQTNSLKAAPLLFNPGENTAYCMCSFIAKYVCCHILKYYTYISSKLHTTHEYE